MNRAAGSARLDLDGDFVNLGHDRNRRRRRVYPALLLRRRHALHAVHARLAAQHLVDAVAADEGGGLAEAAQAVDLRVIVHRELPAVPPRVLRVHLEELARKEARLEPASAREHLEHDVAVVVRVGRHHQREKPVLPL